MKKMLGMVVVLLATATAMNAQVYKETDKSVKTRVNTLWKQAKKGVKSAEKDVSDFLGIEKKKDSDDITIDGVKYMPLYTKNLFYADSTGMLERCRQDFSRRYPSAKIISVAIPQKTWIEAAKTSGSKVKAYKRTAYCYVLAKDGADGYINVRYLFQSMREPGRPWVYPEEYWPYMDRADAIPNAHYQEMRE